jgi:iron complex outermembrane receptor protein
MRAFALLLLAGTASPALAQETPAPPTPLPDPAPAAEPAPAAVQDVPQTAPAAEPEQAVEADGEDDAGEDIVVTGSRAQRGAVVGDIAPEQQLSPADIRSYGVNSITELLNELSPQTRSGRGAGGGPVVLLNGRRISGFQEIRDIPTEAIQRVDILPEEVALKYGYRADQRVVNFVLRRRFRAVTAELEDRIATEGGRQTPDAEVDWLRINNNGRANLHLEYSRADSLTEADRDIEQSATAFTRAGNVRSADGGALDAALGEVTMVAVPGVAASRAPLLADFTPAASTDDRARYRTLLPATRTIAANATYATTVLGNVAATLNATLDHSTTRALRGLPGTTLELGVGSPFSPFAVPVEVTRAFDDPLEQRGRTTAAHLGGALNGDSGRWRWSLTANVDRNESDTRTQTGLDPAAFQARLDAGDPTANPYGTLALPGRPDNTGRSLSTEAGLVALASGPLLRLPAGDASTSIRIGASTSDFSSRSSRNAVEQEAQIGRDVANAQVNLDLPVADHSEGVLAALGDLSVNGNVAFDRLSDVGTLWTLGYGANWRPVTGVRFLASFTAQDEAPSAAQLGNPTVLTPAVSVFDYVRGTTATVTTVTGGNAQLATDTRHVMKLGADVRPWSGKDISFIANYVTQRVEDPIASFPTASAAIEAAFPDRFLRDGEGRLVQLDSRPINFARTESAELRYGINLSFRVKSQVQKQLEAYRAGTGPNPFEGLRPPGRPRDATRPDGSAMEGGRAPLGEGGARGTGGWRGPGAGRFAGAGRFGGAGQGSGRVQFALYHTVHFVDRVTVADGGPVLDLLRGDAIGSSGGQPRHEIEGQAGYSNNGLGARLSVNFRSATEVNGGTPAVPETLDFGSLATANLRLFADLGQRPQWVRAHPWLRGTRVSVSLDNLFNTRQRVTDATGEVPIGFQPGYLDPIGRTLRIAVRKLFF